MLAAFGLTGYFPHVKTVGWTRRATSGADAGLLVGLVVAVITYAIVKPGPCSQTSICILDRTGGCRPGPCDGRSHHVLALALIIAVFVIAGSCASLLRRRE